jgi:hypothetical protein
MIHLTDVIKEGLAGPVTSPGDPEWDTARRAWNLAVDQRPAVVVEPTSADDVKTIVDAARRSALRVAVQSTGHGAGPLGPLDGAVLLKTSRMRAVSISPDSRTARIEAGARAGDVADAAGEHGLAPVAGFAPTVGMTGLTLGGGIGWLSRSYGLAANNVRAIELVTADGEHRRVDTDTDADLFWALRGGGGNFGVVTALEIELHPVPEAVAARLVWPAQYAAEVIEQYREWTRDLPDAMSSALRFIDLPDQPIVSIAAVHLGSLADAERLLRPLRSSATTMVDVLATVAPAGIARVAGDPEEPVPALGQGVVVRDLDLDLTDLIADRIVRDVHKPLAALEIRHLGGALARTAPGHGALDKLDGAFTVSAGGPGIGPVARAAEAALRELHESLRPWATQASLNFSNLPTDPATAFGTETYRELGRVRAAVDPHGLFVANHPIPAAAPILEP